MKKVSAKHKPISDFPIHKVKQVYVESDRVKRTREENNHSWYYSRRWQKIRQAHISASPLCLACLAEGRLFPGEVVDHVTPHRGDGKLFWNAGNLQTLCFAHHNYKTAKEKQGEFIDYRGKENE